MRVEESQQEAWFSEFAAMGEMRVRIALEAGDWETSRTKLSCAKVWLLKEEEKRYLEVSARRAAREEETLEIARSARASVRYDRYIAIAATIIAMIAAREDIAWLIGLLLDVVKP